MRVKTQDTKYEDSIVWERDPRAMDYVRQVIVVAPRRRGPIKWARNRVGYAELRPNAPNNGYPGRFYRRVFYLRDHDRPNNPSGVYRTGSPVEAVDPRTVRPGVPGLLTDRAWYGESGAA
jgi:hypothetical protein